MEKAKYVIINSDNKYFVEILSNNKIAFDKDKTEAREVDWEEGQELISYIEFKTGKVCDLESI